MTDRHTVTGASRRCQALCRDGTPCKAWAVRGNDPPRCSSHGGARARDVTEERTLRISNAGVGDVCGDTLPAVSVTARAVHEMLIVDVPDTIEQVIADLASKQQLLSAYIDQCLREGTDLAALARLFALHGQNASRLGRLLRDQRALSGAAADGISGAIAQALDELSTELETSL